VAGTGAQGRRSVAVWLTSSAVSMYLASNRLRSSPLVQVTVGERKKERKKGDCFDSQSSCTFALCHTTACKKMMNLVNPNLHRTTTRKPSHFCARVV